MEFARFTLSLLLCLLVNPSVTTSIRRVPAHGPVLHIPIAKRGGHINHLGPAGEANLTYVHEELDRVHRRYALSKREIKGNKLTRRPPSNEDQQHGLALGDMGKLEKWYGVVDASSSIEQTR